VRYVNRILPPDSPRRVLFADGKKTTSDVLYLDKQNNGKYRAPNLATIDGPSQLVPFHDSLVRVARDGVTANAAAPPPLLLYFTGHGSPGRGNYDNNRDCRAAAERAGDARHGGVLLGGVWKSALRWRLAGRRPGRPADLRVFR
jgi:hypothetical protein